MPVRNYPVNQANELRALGETDQAAAGEIVDLTYRMLHEIDLVELSVPEVKTPDVVGVSGVCVEVSDVVTRAAHRLGIMAARECHSDTIMHYLTSFAPPDREPAEDDLIMCLTWGQFNAYAYREQPGHYFGPRQGIYERVNSYYHSAYSSWSTHLKQIAHTPGLLPRSGHVWLETTYQEVARGGCPLGEVPRDNYPPEMWEYEPGEKPALV